jgi:WS/DGAT/MGAT family acyltransferase
MIRTAGRVGAFGRCETLRDRRHQGPPPAREPLAREDRAILQLESATVAGHTLKIAILDPPPDHARPDVDALRARIGERSDGAPRLRRRLEQRPAGGRTAWVDDPTFDVREHVREVPVAQRFSYEDLRRFCARLMEERLDRSRPLWTIDLVAPFEDDGVVVVWRLHHALADGAIAMRWAEEVLWDRPDRSVCQTARETSSLLLALREGLAARRPGRLPGALRRELRRTHPPSPLDGAIGASRTVAFASTSLSALKRATKALVPAATVNDAVLAIVAGGLRRWMEVRGSRLHSLRAKVPVSLHHGAESSLAANRDSFFCVGLPLGEPDPVERLRRINEGTMLRKRAGDPVVLDTLLRDIRRVAPPVGHLLERLALDPRAFTLNISNIVGPAERPTLMSAPVCAFYSLAEIDDRHALRVAVVSMADALYFGLCADPAIVGELDSLVTGIRAEAAALADRAGTAEPGGIASPIDPG